MANKITLTVHFEDDDQWFYDHTAHFDTEAEQEAYIAALKAKNPYEFYHFNVKVTQL